MISEKPIDFTDAFFEKTNFYSGENFDLYTKLGKKKGLIEYINKKAEESLSKGHSGKNFDQDSNFSSLIPAQSIFLLLVGSMGHDLLEVEISRIILPVFLIISLFYGFYFVFFKVFQISSSQNDKPSKQSNKNALSLQFSIKKGEGENLTIKSEDIKLGDQVLVQQGPIPFNAIVIKGVVILYQKSESGEYSVERKTEDTPFILKNSYIIEGEGVVIACSDADVLPSNFMENFKNVKFKIETDENSTLKLPKDFSTTDYELKLFADYLNSKEGWELIMEENLCKIERKMLKGSEVPVMRTAANIENFTLDEIFEAIVNIEVRKKWDSNFTTFDLVESNPDGSDLLYMALKSPNAMLFQARDLVQRRRIYPEFPNKNSKLIHFKSVESSKCPVKPEYTRAHTFISGYYIIQEEVNPPKCKVYIVSQTDVGGTIPKFLVNSVSVKAPKDWITNLIKGCELIKSTAKN